MGSGQVKKGSDVGMTTKSLVWILIALLGALCVSAIVPINPPIESSLIEEQPLFSWTDYSGAFDHYVFVLYKSSSTSVPIQEATTTEPYHQSQGVLAVGDYSWKVRVFGAENVFIEETPLYDFTIINPPHYTVTPNFARYTDNKRVEFSIDAPLGSSVNILISSDDFSLPFITNNLGQSTFTTFLDPGDYRISATFVTNGLTTTFSDTFTIEAEDEPEMYELSFNITDVNNSALNKVNIFIENNHDEYDKKTNADGVAWFNVTEGEYDFTLSLSGYITKEFTEDITKDKSFRFRLDKEPVVVQEVRKALDPVVEILSPTYKQKFTAPSLVSVRFSLEPLAAFKSCELLSKYDDQSSWRVESSSTSLSTETSIDSDSMTEGDVFLKVRCKTKDGKTIESTPRSIIIASKEAQSLITDFLEQLDQAKNTKKPANIPFAALHIDEDIARARQELIDLDNRYQEAVDKGDTTQAKTLKEDIAAKIADVSTTLIKSVTVQIVSDEIFTPHETKTRELIESYVETQDYEDKKKLAKATEILMEYQQEFAIRSKTSVLEITTMDDSTSYMTILTRTVQSLTDSDDVVMILEDVPLEFFQLSGIPKLLSQTGSSLGSINEGKVLISGQNIYNYQFTGKVDTTLLDSTALAVVRSLDDEELLSQSGFSLITGEVISSLQDQGISASVAVWFIIALVLLGAFYNPVYTVGDYRKNRQIRAVTDTMHSAFDHLQNGRHKDLITHYDSLIEKYDSLPKGDQAELLPMMSYLGGYVSVFRFRESVQSTAYAINRAMMSDELSRLQMHLTRLSDQYQLLSDEHQHIVYPWLAQLYQLYQQKYATMRR